MARWIGRTALGFAAALALGASAQAQAFDGDWRGTLAAGGQALRLVLHVHTDKEGTDVSIDSLDQGAMDIPGAAMKQEPPNLGLLFLGIGGAYDATLSADGKTLTGKWTQGANVLPLVLTLQPPAKP
ncbi:MAG: hypothetical protein ABI655_02790 [Phenylobacterium sp.]